MLEVDFKLEEMVSMEGETGPYLQYTYARAASLLRKAAAARGHADGRNDAAPILLDALDSPAARSLLKKTGGYAEAIRSSVRENEPSVLARYLLDLAKAYNRFYNSERILGADPAVMAAKLRLSSAAARVLKHGLGILGIAAPDRI